MEPVGADEPNSVVLTVTKDMNKDQVLAEVLRRIELIKAEEKPAGGFLEGFYKTKNCNFNLLKVLTLSSFIAFNLSLLSLKMAGLAVVILLALSILSKLNMEILVGFSPEIFILYFNLSNFQGKLSLR